MEPVELRPLSLGELLDRTFQLYRNYFWVFVGIMAIPSSFGIPMSFAAFSRQGSPVPFNRPLGTPQPTLPLSFFGFAFLFWVVYSIVLGAATQAVAEAYLGRQPTVRGGFRRVRQSFWELIGLVLNVGGRVFGIFVATVFLAALSGGVIVGIAAVAGGQRAQFMIIAAVVTALLLGGGLGIFLALRYAVSIPALLLERLGVRAAIRRSVQLTKGRRGQIFLAAMLTSIMGYVGVVVFQGPFWLASIFIAPHGNAPAWLNFAAAISVAVGRSVTSPLLMIILVLCYYDSRIRKEAFDLQFMMASLDNPAPAAGTVSPA